MISRKELLKLAELARLQLDEAEVERFQKDIAQMLDYVKLLDEADTSSTVAGPSKAMEVNVLRDDVARASLRVEEALKNAPQREGDFFKVPRVVDN